MSEVRAINKGGRPKGSKTGCNFDGITTADLRKLLKRVLPYTNDAITLYAQTMNREDMSESERMKAAKELMSLLFVFQRELDKRLGLEDDESSKELESNIVRFSTDIPR